jgi:predicted metal-dependent phosphotriesterase family hydrolase
MSFVRTVLGDIEPSQMGVTYSHEHIVIEESFPVLQNPDFLLNDTAKISAELKEVYIAGGRTMVDTMPAACGRNVIKLAEVSRLSRIQIIAPTGIHLPVYYPPRHWQFYLSEEQLTQLFIDDVVIGIDRYDYSSPVVERTSHKAGMIKLASGDESFDDNLKKIFRAVVATHKKTGVPILTHTNAGKHAVEQAELFYQLGADLSHVVISHVDRCNDLGYHQALMQTGVRVEYDSAFRWKPGGENFTFLLLEKLLSDYPDQITVGMDAARHTYWKSYGGKPGLTYLLTDFITELHKRGLADYQKKIFIENPRQLYAFVK